uniref:Reverse transcriptase domain-containing protein n=1 Tax=Tanacetum cinerariifolium TaxID=118510 RepID=A0A6L2LY04_TANCI|nr:hypothetical protein [Tanacetum cinerariifolium]
MDVEDEMDDPEIINQYEIEEVPLGVEDSPFNMDEDILFLKSLLMEDPSPPYPIIPNQTKSPIEEPKHSFNMENKHFNTNLVTNDVAESSTKNLVPIPRESKVISENGNLFIPIHIIEEERIKREHAEYINRMEMLFTINPRPHPSTYAKMNVKSFSSLPIPIQESDEEEIDVVTKTDDVLPPSVENDDSDGEVDAVDDLRVDNSISNSEHEFSESEDSNFDNPSVPLPPSEPPDEEFDFEIDFGDEILVVRNMIVKFECIDARVKFDVFNDENDDLSYFMFVKVFSLLSAESEDTIFDLDTSSDSEPEVEAEDEDENEVATVSTITRAPYRVQPFSGTTYVGSGSSRKVFAPGPIGKDVDNLHRKVKSLAQHMFERANTEYSTLKRLSEMDRYLGGISMERRIETREHHELKQSVSTLEYQMRGLMLEDKEEKERLKKKLRVSQQEKEQMEQAFCHVVDWIRKQFRVEIPPCMSDGDATTQDNAHP